MDVIGSEIQTQAWFLLNFPQLMRTGITRSWLNFYSILLIGSNEINQPIKG
jgi:hypothetical protein